MSTTNLIPCGCCREGVDVAAAVMDTELQAHVCPDCRRELRNAKAFLATPCDGNGAPIAIRGVYHGRDAPDNLPRRLSP